MKAGHPRSDRPPRRRRPPFVIAAALTAGAVVVACGREGGEDRTSARAQGSKAAPVVYELGPAAVRDLDTTKVEKRELKPDVTPSKPVTATTYDVDGEIYVRIDGDWESLEGLVPDEGLTEVDRPAGRGQVTSKDGHGYLWAADPATKGIERGDVAVIGPPAKYPDRSRPPEAFVDLALRLAGPDPGKTGDEVDRADLSSLAGAAAGTILSYGAQPAPAMEVFTFPSASLSPVLEHLPTFERTEVGGRPAYSFGTPSSIDRPLGLMFEGPDGGLVVLTAPGDSTLAAMRSAASHVRRAEP